MKLRKFKNKVYFINFNRDIVMENNNKRIFLVSGRKYHIKIEKSPKYNYAQYFYMQDTIRNILREL